MISVFSEKNLRRLCDKLGKSDEQLRPIIDQYGYPPMWSRPNTFESLVHIILEQQVSLASALAALNKLRERLVDITPEGLQKLTDEELKACYFSRQKAGYVKYLAEALLHKHIDLTSLETLGNDEVRKTLSSLKGIGNWTIDIYLIFVLHRVDIFPVGDLAAVNALKRKKQLPSSVSKEELVTIASQWAPLRTIATMLLWHYYLSLRVKQ